MKIEHFTQDNTEGYTDAQLIELNDLLNQALITRRLSNNPDDWSDYDREVVQTESERIFED